MRSTLSPFHRTKPLWLLFALCTTGLTAQERPLPSSAEPPDLQQFRRLSKPPRSVQSPSMDQVLRQLGLTRAQIERRKVTSRAAPLPASPVEPPDLAELKRSAQRPPAPAPSPTIKDVLEALRRQPGGAAMIERAKRAGARIPSDAAMDLQAPADRARATNLYSFAARENRPAEVIQGTPTIRVTRGTPSQTVAGFGSLTVYAFYPYYVNSGTTWGPLYRSLQTGSANPVGAPWDVKPYVSITFNATTAGWYVINVVGGESGFQARHYAAGAYQLVQTFPLPATPGTYSYPVLLNLTAGSHYFAWANLNYLNVSEVSVVKF